MNATHEQHLAFWRKLSEQISDGVSLGRALTAAGEAAPGNPLCEVTEEMIRDLEAGESFGQAMAKRRGLFSRAQVALVRAGEVGGVMDVIVERIVEGIEDGSLPLPGVEREAHELERYFRCFGRLIGSGVPILEALEIVGDEVAGPELAAATDAIRRSVLEGRSIAQSMGESPDVFPSEIIQAMDIGEETGNVDRKAFEIADALAGRDLSLLGEARMDELPPVRRFTNVLLLGAIGAGASDIHLEPTEDGAGRFRLRIDGVLHDFEWPDEMDHPGEAPYGEVVNRLKLMAGVDLTERRLPQDGRIQLDVSGRRIDLRANFLPAMHGERVAMRIFDREAMQVTFDLDVVVRDEGQRELIRDLCHRPHGLVLCAGPTGSGKTTVLYAMLQEFNLDACSAITIEDPVEYTFEKLVQVNVDPRIGRTFAVAARSVFRQDPDVVLIGEIRNEEVAMLAAQFALTGHVCLSSLHVETAPVALRRLVDMGVPDFVVNSAVIGVVCPRLVRVLCEECKAPQAPALHSLPPEARSAVEEAGEGEFHEPIGCAKCNGTGYRGRMALFEVLIPDDGVKEVLAAGGDEAALREAALREGMKPLLRAGLEAAARGLTSVREVLRVV